MPLKNYMENIANILKIKKPIKTTKYQWQEKAMKATEQLSGAEKRKGSVFKCFKDNEKNADHALNDCKELGQMHVLYFFKVYSEIRKRQC